MKSLSGKTVIILSGGKAKRYMGLPKQLVDVCGETLMARMVRQVRRYTENIYVNTQHGEIRDEAQRLGCEIIDCGTEGTTQLGWYETRNYWGKRIFILWGDVVFSKDAIDKVFTVPGFRMFGSVNQEEGFAFAYDWKDTGRILRALSETHFEDWKFYRQMIKMPLYMRIYDNKIFYDFKDYTTDIDYPIEYRFFLEEIVNKGKIDDALPRARLKYDEEFLNKIELEGIVGRAKLKVGL